MCLSPRSHRRKLTGQIAAYCQQWERPSRCDADFAVPHRFPKVVPALLFATSGTISIDICAGTRTVVFQVTSEVGEKCGFEIQFR